MTDIVDIGLAVDSTQVERGTSALGRFGRQAGKTQKATDRLNASLKSSARHLGIVASSAAAASAAFTVVKIREFEKAMSDLSAITGATGRQLDFLRQKSLEFGATTTLSASQAADAFKLIASAKPDLLDNAAALSKVTREAITLSEAAGITLADAANALGASLNQFNAGAKESTRFINVLAAGAKYGASEIGQTAEALRMAGTVAASAGLSFEQTNAAIQALASVAIKGSEAGTGLRGVLMKLSTQSRAEFNPEVVGFTKAIQNLAHAHLTTTEKAKLFGQESITAANALIKEADNLGTLTDKLTGTNTAYDQASTRTNNLDGDLKQLGSAIEGAALSFQRNLNPELRAIVQELTNATNGFATFISVMSGAKTQLAMAVKLQDLREQLRSAEADFKSLAENGAASLAFFGEGMLGGVDSRMAKLGQTIETLKAQIKATELDREAKIIENAGANMDAYFQAVDAGASRAEAKMIAFAQAKADAMTTGGAVGAVDPSGAATGATGQQDAEAARRERILIAEAQWNADRIQQAQDYYDQLRQLAYEAQTSEEQQITDALARQAEIIDMHRQAQIQAGIDQRTADLEAQQAYEDATIASLARLNELKAQKYQEDYKRKSQYQKFMLALDQQQYGSAIQMFGQFASMMTALGGKNFEQNKKVQIAIATIKGMGTVMNAIEHGSQTGGIYGAAIEGAIATATVAAQIMKIKSASIGSGGGVSAPTGAGAAAPTQQPAAPVAQPQQQQPQAAPSLKVIVNAPSGLVDPIAAQQLADSLAPHMTDAMRRGMGQAVV